MIMYIYILYYIYIIICKNIHHFFGAKSQMIHDEVPNFFGFQGSAEACQVHQAPVAKAADFRDCYLGIPRFLCCQ